MRLTQATSCSFFEALDTPCLLLDAPTRWGPDRWVLRAAGKWAATFRTRLRRRTTVCQAAPAGFYGSLRAVEYYTASMAAATLLLPLEWHP